MKKTKNIFYEIMEIDPQNGKLRLIFGFIIFFIIWSFFALAAALYDPFPTISSLWPNNLNNSTNLASDLWNEIIASFFSVYTISYLLMLMLAFIAAYLLVKTFVSFAAQTTRKTFAGKFLRSCAFSIPDYLNLNTAKSDFENSDEFRIINSLGGPFYLQLSAPSAAILQNNAGEFRTVPPPQAESETILIGHQERISALLDTNEKQTTMTFDTLCQDGRKVLIKKMCISYSIIPSEKRLFMSGTRESGKVISQIAMIAQATNWDNFIAQNLRLNLNAILLNYSSLEIQNHIEQAKANAAPLQPAPAPLNSHLSHSIPQHGRLYPLPTGYYRRPDTGIILRNRRRSILPELRKYKEIEFESEAIPENGADFKQILSEQLTDSFNSIFSIPVIQFTILKTGEISFNEIH